jgi:hypothetical protein
MMSASRPLTTPGFERDIDYAVERVRVDLSLPKIRSGL